MSNRKLGVTRRAFMYLAGLTALPFGQSVIAHNKNNRSDGMIVVRVLFPVSAGTDIDELKKKMAATAVKYEGLDGLTRKYYVLSDDQKQVGGIYLWENREVAEAWYNEGWYDAMTEAWGERPFVEYQDCLVVVDNEVNKITSKVAA